MGRCTSDLGGNRNDRNYFFSDFLGDYYTAQEDINHNGDDNDASSRAIIATVTTTMLNMIYDITMMSHDVSHMTHIMMSYDDVELP